MTGKADELQVKIGRAIRKSRRAADLTQTELGEKVDVTYQQIQKYEKGQSRIAAVTLLHIMAVLNVEASRPMMAWIARSQK